MPSEWKRRGRSTLPRSEDAARRNNMPTLQFRAAGSKAAMLSDLDVQVWGDAAPIACGNAV